MTQGHLPLNSYFGSYFVVRLIAVGGMAEIYHARTKGLAGFEKQLALKVIHPDYADDKTFIEMLVNEAKIAVGLNHHNIVQTFDLGQINNQYFISMEFVDGADFFQILKRLSEVDNSIPVDAAVFVTHEALCGLQYAHTKTDEQGRLLKIVHRDMSPQNILLSRHGEVKITDFGIAKAANLTNKTRAGVIKGKLVYMSPEQAWGDPIDHRTDIFSMGIVLYEALTGGSLYLEKNPVRLLEMVRKAEIKPPSARRRDVPTELDALVMKALSPRPADRYQSAGEFAAGLGDLLRRIAPGYTDQSLGELVEAVLAGAKPSPSRRSTAPRDAAEREKVMAREDFAQHQHSIIFSAEDMLQSAAAVGGAALKAASRSPRPPAASSPPDAAPALASGGARAKLLLLENTEAKPFVLGKEFIIGRSGDLRLGDARVSRRHARIALFEGAYLLEDLGSANGSFLNEEKIAGPVPLQSGDVIRVGPFEMRFVVEEVSQSGAAPVPVISPALAPVLPASEDSFADELTPAVTGTPPALPPLAPPSGSRSSPLDLTEGRVAARRDGALVSVTLGAESLIVPVGDGLPLAHTLALGEMAVAGESASLMRRPDGYWIEPSPTGEPVYHNGKPVTVPTPLHSGDVLQVGPLQLEFIDRSAV